MFFSLASTSVMDGGEAWTKAVERAWLDFWLRRWLEAAGKGKSRSGASFGESGDRPERLRGIYKQRKGKSSRKGKLLCTCQMQLENARK